jgi:hypothetical protein
VYELHSAERDAHVVSQYRPLEPDTVSYRRAMLLESRDVMLGVRLLR